MSAPQILTVPLTLEEAELINRPINADRDGDWQTVTKRLKRGLRIADGGGYTIEIFPQDLAKIQQWVQQHEGGYQDRWKAVLRAVDRFQAAGRGDR